MKYHLYRRNRKRKGKDTKFWYYWYLENDKQVSRVCPSCKTKSEAEIYIQSLSKTLCLDNRIVLKDITENMYLEGGSHLLRRQEMGKPLSSETIIKSRNFLNLINSQWGNFEFKDISVQKVTDYLIEDNINKNNDGSVRNHSGSWKNEYLIVLREIFKEGVYRGVVNTIPQFPKFARQMNKADIFSTKEINDFFRLENFSNETLFLFFLLTFTEGLRLGETRGIRRSQILVEYNTLVVDGFIRVDGTRTNFNKKGSPDNPKIRWCLIPDKILQLLIDYCNRNNIETNDYIFQKSGKPLRKEYADANFKRAVKAANINIKDRKLCPHSLRYTYVTRMRRDLPAEIVAKIVGNNSVDMTNYYTRPNTQGGIQSILPTQGTVERLFI